MTRLYEATKGHTMPDKAIRGHIRQYKANMHQFHNVLQKITPYLDCNWDFMSIFCFNEHFLNLISRQAEEEQEQEQKSFFLDL